MVSFQYLGVVTQSWSTDSIHIHCLDHWKLWCKFLNLLPHSEHGFVEAHNFEFSFPFAEKCMKWSWDTGGYDHGKMLKYADTTGTVLQPIWTYPILDISNKQHNRGCDDEGLVTSFQVQKRFSSQPCNNVCLIKIYIKTFSHVKNTRKCTIMEFGQKLPDSRHLLLHWHYL